MEDKRMRVYTDGSYTTDHPHLTGWAYAFIDDDKVFKLKSGTNDDKHIVKMHQIGGELIAVMLACHEAKRDNIKIEINYDYTGIYYWAYDKWKAKKSFTKRYKNFIKPFVEDGTVTFKKVPKSDHHKGFNKIVDDMAYNAILKEANLIEEK